MRILVTGASGFVGKRLCSLLTAKGFDVRSATRYGPVSVGSENCIVGEIGPSTDWSKALDGIDAIVHLAARVHVMHERSSSSLEEYRRINVDATRRLAEEAVRRDVRRFVFVSTIKVHGENSGQIAFDESSPVAPSDSYSVSKWEAEQILASIAAGGSLDPVIIRPPLVYGPGVKGNLYRLMQHIKLGRPFPVGSQPNIRSLISLNNLVDILEIAATRPEASGKTFVVSDGRGLSTAELVRLIASAMGKKPRFLSLPIGLLTLLARHVRQLHPIIERIQGNLVINNAYFLRTFSWVPPQTVEDGVREMVDDFVKGASSRDREETS